MRAILKPVRQTALMAILLLPVSDNKIGASGSWEESISNFACLNRHQPHNIQNIPSLKTHRRRNRLRNADSTLNAIASPGISTTYLIGFLVILVVGLFGVLFLSSMKPNSPALEDHAVSRSTPDTIVTLPPMKPNGPALEDHAVSRSTLDTIVAVPEYTTIPGQYLEASVSDLIEMAAIVKTIAKSSTRLLMIREKGLPFPGQAPLADTWGNLSFLRGLPGGSPQLIEKYRLEIVDRLAFGLESDGNLPLWFDDDYMYSLRFKFVGDMPAYVQVLRFPSPRHCSATNTCGTA